MGISITEIALSAVVRGVRAREQDLDLMETKMLRLLSGPKARKDLPSRIATCTRGSVSESSKSAGGKVIIISMTGFALRFGMEVLPK